MAVAPRHGLFFDSWVRRPLGALLAATTVAAAGTAVYEAAASGPGGGAVLTAHLWVDTNGGTCSRNAIPQEYDDAGACGSLDAANDVCQNGDTVLVKGGTYGAQTITGSNSRTSTCTFSVAAAETATVMPRFGSGLDTGDGVSHLLLDADMRMVTTTADLFIQAGSNNIEIRDFDGTNFFVRGAQAMSNITIRGGDWGPCAADDLASNCNAKIDANVTDMLIDGAYLHDLACSDHVCTDCTDGTPACDVHMECLIVFKGATGLTVRNSKFHDCEFMDIFIQQAGEAGGNTTDVTIENNWFGQPWNGQGSKSRSTGVVLDGNASTLTDYLIRFNSFESGTGIAWNSDADATTYTNVRGVGNIDGLDGTGTACSDDWTVTYTVYRGASACAGTGNVAFNAAFPYVSGTGDASMDFHLTGSTTSIDNLVPTSAADGCGPGKLEIDYDAGSRPAGSSCDAGADER